MQYESKELEAAIQKSLNTLPAAYRLVLVLVDIQGLTYDEAATAANIPIGTVKSRLARARLRMQRLLQTTGEILPASYREKLPLSVQV
jgi:RNA polymerase sigma-70 factor (ECF subfamily)